MKVEHKSVSFNVKEMNEKGEFSGYASVFGLVDQGGDSIDHKAFDHTLAEHKAAGTLPFLLWQHRMDEPIGIWTSMKVDKYGLKVKGRLIEDVQRGREAAVLMRHKAVRGLSIGYRTLDADYSEKGVRLLKKIDLVETSIVTSPMQKEAQITDVKSLGSIRDVERVLRDAGVPSKFAKLVAAHGYEEAKSIVDQRDADFDHAQAAKLLLKLKQNTRNFRNG